ncbi:hypothetical protein PACTADRAFT_2247 [Pachysolen tannophilus NRRL Y-2460]|uniref:Cystinosin n=1 Tax=Pachysolen tannophilus NRRL Y-2460 TaxID=669874 RepID=A0A1E4TVY2_PACTA|nr:hypothetical protein PACTADRAFT_2247 [Pachysolen tannophilus NRRL Y-2460]
MEDKMNNSENHQVSKLSSKINGISVDFLFLNTLGYCAYLTSLSLQVYNNNVRDEFHQKYDHYPLLSYIDVIYAAHGLILNLVTISQIFCSGYKRTVSKRVSFFTKCFYCFFLVIVGFQLLLIRSRKLLLLELVINLSYIKVLISFLKYLPQLMHNYKRKSCSGFSITQIWLDLCGGTFALAQLFLDNIVENDSKLNLEELLNNKGKLGLSLVTFFFDSAFLIQYYIIYKNSAPFVQDFKTSFPQPQISQSLDSQSQIPLQPLSSPLLPLSSSSVSSSLSHSKQHQLV